MIIGQTRAAAAGKLIPAYNRHSGTSGRLPQVPSYSRQGQRCAGSSRARTPFVQHHSTHRDLTARLIAVHGPPTLPICSTMCRSSPLH